MSKGKQQERLPLPLDMMGEQQELWHDAVRHDGEQQERWQIPICLSRQKQDSWNLAYTNEEKKQEAKKKIDRVSIANWHFIGAIQSNKTKEIAKNFDWVHSVDSEKLARRLSEHRDPKNGKLKIFIQVNSINQILFMFFNKILTLI